MKLKQMLVLALAVCTAGLVKAEDAYIETDGTQAFVLDYYANPATKIVADFAWVDTTTVQQRLFGPTDNAAQFCMGSYINSANCYAWAMQDNTGNWASTGVKVTTDRVLFVLNSGGDGNYDGSAILLSTPTKGNAKYDWTNTTCTKKSVMPLTIAANCTPQGFSDFGKLKIFSFSVYEKESLLHHLLPYSDGKTVGLYDTVTKQFLTPAVGSAPRYVASTETLPKLRIMPLGDSITQGVGGDGGGGYRLPLYHQLTEAGYRVNFVGHFMAQPAADLPQPLHEGHSGWKIGDLQKHMIPWLEGIDDPDIVLMHIGTNDSGDTNFHPYVDKLDTLISTIIATRPKTHILVTTLLPRTDYPDRNARIEADFNPYIEPLVQRHQELGHRVHFLDMHSKLDASQETKIDMNDGLHPHKEGYVKMAEAWAEPIQQIFSVKGDARAPEIARASASEDGRIVQVNFAKPMTADAATVSKWSVPGSTVQGVQLLDDGRLAVLTLATPLAAGAHAVAVAGVAAQTDPAATVNLSATFGVPEPFNFEKTVPESEWKQYNLIYQASLPVSAQFASNAFSYDVDNSAATVAFDRVAYYLQLETQAGERQWVWVSMDAFTDELDQIGIPTFASRIVHKKNVTNLNVWSNVADVENGTGIAGAIEFWPYNYDNPTQFGVDDVMYSSGRYGSMQVHNMAARKTIFAFNHFGDAGVKPCIGIGSSPATPVGNNKPSLDWTFHENADLYRVRELKIFARVMADTVAPTALSAKVGAAGTQVFVEFSEPLDASKLSPSSFKGFTVKGLRLLDDGKTVVLRTDPVDPGVALNVAGVKDLSGNASAEQQLTLEAYGLPADLVARVGAADLAGYELVYALDIPVVGNFYANESSMYWYDQSDAAAPVDRVAYYMELENFAGDVTYVMTAFDAPTADRAALGVPLATKNTAFQRKVKNGYVRSNVNGLDYRTVNGDLALEFWSPSYNKEDFKGWGGSGGDYDWSDQMTGYPYEKGYGSMQVNNVNAKTTLWSMTNFGNDGSKIGIGFGNSNIAGHGDAKDWTFAENAANYLKRKLYVLARPKNTSAEQFDAAEALTREAAEKVGADRLAGYKLVGAVTKLYPQMSVKDPAWVAANKFYTVNRTAEVTAFDRVAYFVQGKQAGDSEPRWIWTAMDAFTDQPQCLLAPTAGCVIQTKVANLDVLSNVEGIVTGDGLETGCIEFAPSNYAEGTGTDQWTGSGSVFDWNDTNFTTSAGHGCWQVHNYGAGQTLWALNNFNNAKNCGFGIGNEPGSGHKDWTHQANGTSYSDVRILVFVRETGAEEVVRKEVAANVGAEALDGFEMLFAITNVPGTCRLNDRNWDDKNLYCVNKRYAYQNGAFDRVAYYMEVQYKNEATPRYVWVAMDPFSEKAYQLGVPFGGYFFQQRAGNMDVLSNDPHITSGTGLASGVVEFAASNYNNARGTNEWEDDGGVYGWNDSNFTTAQGHGSMQIHNAGAGEVLMSFGHYNNGSEPYLGVGANQFRSNNDPDYTFTYNVNQYQKVRIVGFVRPHKVAGASTLPAPQPQRAVVAVSRRQIAVKFDATLASYAAGGSFEVSDGVKVEDVRRYNDTWLVMGTTKLQAGKTYTLTCSVPGVDGAAKESVLNFTVPSVASFALPDNGAAVAELPDYRLAYYIDLPENRKELYRDAKYLIDEEFFFNGSFDRVAYCLELVDAKGESKWAWASMDAFTDNIYNIALPTPDRGKMFQQKVANMNVYASANAGVTTGSDIQTGNIEFWPSNYGGGTTFGDIGGSASAFDWDDNGGGTGEGYGSFQIHNWGAKQPVLAVNSFGSGGGEKVCVGLGLNTTGTGEPDWTHAYNASNFAKRRLWVFFRETAPSVDGKGPDIYVQPVDQRVRLGDTVTLAVKTGAATAYQWYCNGKAVSGQTSATLTMSVSSLAVEGEYLVLVRGTNGTTLSKPAFVEVLNPGSLILFR